MLSIRKIFGGFNRFGEGYTFFYVPNNHRDRGFKMHVFVVYFLLSLFQQWITRKTRQAINSAVTKHLRKCMYWWNALDIKDTTKPSFHLLIRSIVIFKYCQTEASHKSVLHCTRTQLEVCCKFYRYINNLGWKNTTDLNNVL